MASYNYTVYKSIFDGRIDQATLATRISSIPDSNDRIDVVINSIAAAESFAALISKSNPLIGGAVDGALLVNNLRSFRNALESGGKPDHQRNIGGRSPISLSHREPQKKQTQN